MRQRKAVCPVAGRRHDGAVADGLGRQVMSRIGVGAIFHGADRSIADESRNGDPELNQPAHTTRVATPSCGLNFLCAFCAFAFLGLGCSVTRGTREPDGTLTVVNYRLLWSSEAVDFSVKQPATGNSQPAFNAQLKIGKSATDDEAVAAVVEGVVKGITRP